MGSRAKERPRRWLLSIQVDKAANGRGGILVSGLLVVSFRGGCSIIALR